MTQSIAHEMENIARHFDTLAELYQDDLASTQTVRIALSARHRTYREAASFIRGAASIPVQPEPFLSPSWFDGGFKDTKSLR